ncbi:hypothetical protein F0562_000176 [Nyssa sinensis]|uniref:Uncharacterized protein n=1 Tax=Nyssa sinensis TaxID=561372 RepID=A0A5J5C3Q0_9ASTE|nr:hypothetical protein F0562_000176 [Nyssa sinensis]
MFCRLLYTHPTVNCPALSSNHTFRTLSPDSPPIFKHQFSPNSSSPRPNLSLKQTPRPQIRCTVNSDGGTRNWAKWLPRNIFAADKVLRLISGATSSPIGQFISSPTTFLHSVDPRIKLAWLLALVITPARSHILMRFGIVIYLALLSVWLLPKHVWMDQLGRVSLLCGILFVMLGLGPLQLTRKGFSAASASACLTFTIFQSASLCLATTTPEQLAFALQWFMLPLRHVGVPVAEVILTLLLSLRFISLVFDEVRNVALGIVSRRINWKQLTVIETIDGKYTIQAYKNKMLLDCNMPSSNNCGSFVLFA